MCLSFSFSLGLHIGLHIVCNSKLQFVLLNISRGNFCITKIVFFSYKTNDKKDVFITLLYLFSSFLLTIYRGILQLAEHIKIKGGEAYMFNKVVMKKANLSNG